MERREAAELTRGMGANDDDSQASVWRRPPVVVAVFAAAAKGGLAGDVRHARRGIVAVADENGVERLLPRRRLAAGLGRDVPRR